MVMITILHVIILTRSDGGDNYTACDNTDQG